ETKVVILNHQRIKILLRVTKVKPIPTLDATLIEGASVLGRPECLRLVLMEELSNKYVPKVLSAKQIAEISFVLGH
ncbi:hypothetical protein K7432_017629, partial [Basidiobolus ranarum]